jgi:hypothetical protein
MNKPLHQLKITVPLKPTTYLLLSWALIPLFLTALSGDLKQYQWLLCSMILGALSQAIAIVFGGTYSCDTRMTPNEKS